MAAGTLGLCFFSATNNWRSRLLETVEPPSESVTVRLRTGDCGGADSFFAFDLRGILLLRDVTGRLVVEGLVVSTAFLGAVFGLAAGFNHLIGIPRVPFLVVAAGLASLLVVVAVYAEVKPGFGCFTKAVVGEGILVVGVAGELDFGRVRCWLSCSSGLGLARLGTGSETEVVLENDELLG